MIYQVFPDRFAIGSKHTFTTQLARPEFRGFEHAPSWDAKPRPTGRELYGGDLDGIREKIDHLVKLGTTVLYLTPIFDSPSSHRYDTRDYHTIDARLGNEQAFDNLVKACRERKLDLVLDLVPNHTSEEHPWFMEAQENPTSRKRNYYEYDAHGEARRWRGHGHLPELHLENREVLEALVTKRESVVRHWIRRGADGWRIDCANDVGVDICQRIVEATRREGARRGVIGELWAWPAPFFEANALDGFMNYVFRENVILALKGEVSGELLSHNLSDLVRACPPRALLNSWNILGSHDMPRIRTVFGSRELVACALSLAYTFPGEPFLFAGDEVGVEGGEDPDNRRAFPWDESRWDRETLNCVMQLSKVRQELHALREGSYVQCRASSPDVYAFARRTDNARETTVIVCNLRDREVKTRVFTPIGELFDALPLGDRLASITGVQMRCASFEVKLPPLKTAVLVPDPIGARGYDFLKRAPRP